jgi:predicted XRE-type DNA-binding protein
MKTHRQYINEQIKKEPKFAEALAKAEQEVGIAVELAKLWERRGFSQTELAKLTGMKQPQIARLESGAHFPAFPTLQKLLGVPGGQIGTDRGCLPSRSNTTKGCQRAPIVRPQHPECGETSKSRGERP